MNVKVYHLENCSTCKKAAAWLTKHGISATFLSIKKEVPSILELQRAYQRYKNCDVSSIPPEKNIVLTTYR